ncbi:sarcosine dehydrogenase, mitochondrial isoform X2 [Orussus abietinus]|uniref:sarcosine dehydrogenase, mitochondrial isoform X2 n=1 Tax=Orussus abietinus TaxID=222816 RepID=UPI0006259CBB|nr:sarcosine dehydrogenase, mitochondrial isoform X2 [Orussus abietinus]
MLASCTGTILRSTTVQLRERSKFNKRINPSARLKTTKTIPAVPESADVVIIGGGSAGCNALYHLTKYGTKAVLLERAKLTSGTTWHTAGLLWHLRPNDVEVELLRASRNTLSDVEKETGMDPGWTKTGGLYLARSELRLEEYSRLVTFGKGYNIEARLLTRRQTVDLFPLLDDNAIIGAMYAPEDGVIDPSMMTAALTKYATTHGSTVIEECPVTRVLIEKNSFESAKVCGVETPYGVIRTDCILNASGVWSRRIAKMAGVDIPLIPMKHAYVVSESIKEAQGLPNIRDHDGSVYIRPQGSSLCLGGYEPNPIILESVPRDFTFDLYDLDWNVFSFNMKALLQLIPKLSTVGIKTTVCGPESFTPDHKPIMGEDPNCIGLFYSCGYNSAGMMFGGGCGEQIAQWIIHGRPEKYMFNYDIRRFSFEQAKDMIWANERSHESYMKNYDIIFPHDQPLAGRNNKKGALHNELIKSGAVMENSHGWERPGWFLLKGTADILQYDYYGNYGTSKTENYNYATIIEKERTFDFPEHHEIIKQEALACRNQAVLFDMSSLSKFYLCGPQVQQAAEYLLISTVPDKINKALYSCMLNKHGGIEATCTIISIAHGSGGVLDPVFKGKAMYIVSDGATRYHIWVHIRKIIKEKNFQVTLHDVTDQICVLSIQGPNSRKILENVANIHMSNETLPFMYSCLINLNGTLVRVIRVSFVGELGFELHVPINRCKDIYQLLTDSGKKYGMRLSGYRALHSLSSEKARGKSCLQGIPRRFARTKIRHKTVSIMGL